jgi:hypothetical protein
VLTQRALVLWPRAVVLTPRALVLWPSAANGAFVRARREIPCDPRIAAVYSV